MYIEIVTKIVWVSMVQTWNRTIDFVPSTCWYLHAHWFKLGESAVFEVSGICIIFKIKQNNLCLFQCHTCELLLLHISREVSINKIALWKNVRADDRPAERAIIASNTNKSLSRITKSTHNNQTEQKGIRTYLLSPGFYLTGWIPPDR